MACVLKLKQKRNSLYTFLTDPSSSRGALIYSWYMDLLVVASLTTLCLESVPSLSFSRPQRLMWFIIEAVISAHFLFDFVGKSVGSDSVFEYLLTWTALIDVLSIIPFIFVLMSFKPLSLDESSGALKFLSTMKMVRLLRFFRFFRMAMDHLPRISLFWLAVKRSGLALMFLIFYIFGVGFLCAGLLYYAETAKCTLEGRRWVRNEGDSTNRDCNIQNMFGAIWLTVVTMATVGYGEVVPESIFGKIVTSVTMLLTMIFLPMPIAIFGANLTELYLERRLMRRIGKSRRRRRLIAEDKAQFEECSDINTSNNFDNDDTQYTAVNESEVTGSSPFRNSETMSIRDTLNIYTNVESNTERLSENLRLANEQLMMLKRQQTQFEESIIQNSNHPLYQRNQQFNTLSPSAAARHKEDLGVPSSVQNLHYKK